MKETAYMARSAARYGLLFALTTIMYTTTSFALGTDEQRAACTPDVFRLCSSGAIRVRHQITGNPGKRMVRIWQRPPSGDSTGLAEMVRNRCPLKRGVARPFFISC
jgi:hypothetical protein